MAFALPPPYGSSYFNPTVWDINNSPVTQAELALKAPKSNPIFSGTVSATGGGTLSGTFTGIQTFGSPGLTTVPVANDNTSKIPSTSWVNSAITAAPNTILINTNNNDGTYYPTFTATTGTKTELLIDDVTGPFSYNPVTGDFKVGQSLNITTTTIDCRIAIGKNAGLSQAASSVAVGFQAGQSVQGINTVALGIQAGNQNQGADCIAVGVNAGYILQGSGAIAIGSQTAWNRQGVDAVAIGHFAGQGSTPALLVTDFQGSEAVAIGMSAGRLVQGSKSVAMGHNAGLNRQGPRSVAIGNLAASGTTGSVTDYQGADSVAIGPNAGQFIQAIKSVAIGHEAGINRQGGSTGSAIAIGTGAGKGTSGSSTDFQGANAIAIGQNAGNSLQGANCIAIGENAGQTNQFAKSICINGTGVNLPAGSEGFFVKPIANDTSSLHELLQYNTTSGEISYNNSIDIWALASAITALQVQTEQIIYNSPMGWLLDGTPQSGNGALLYPIIGSTIRLTPWDAADGIVVNAGIKMQVYGAQSYDPATLIGTYDNTTGVLPQFYDLGSINNAQSIKVYINNVWYPPIY